MSPSARCFPEPSERQMLTRLTLRSSPWLLARVAELTQGSSVKSSAFPLITSPKAPADRLPFDNSQFRHRLDPEQCEGWSRDRRSPRGPQARGRCACCRRTSLC